MSDRDNDLTMESTTDSAEQIAEGLGVELASADPTGAADDAPADGEADSTVDGKDAEAEVQPVGEVTAQPAKATAPRTKPDGEKPPAKPRSKAVDGAAAAARRESEAKLKVVEAERDAALERIRQIASGQPEQKVVPRSAATVAPIAASSIPDTHPEVAAVKAKLDALGAKPKQADFADFDEFETKKDEWIENRAFLKNRVESVREDVARRETVAQTEANRAAQATADAFGASEAEARTRHADYDEQLRKAKEADMRVSDDMATALMESPHGGELRYYLCIHPEEVTRINALTPHRQVAELGKIEDRIAASLKTTARPGESTRPMARTTRAPEPQRHLVGDLPSAATTRDLNDPNLTLPEYNRLRDQMDRDSGRRTH